MWPVNATPALPKESFRDYYFPRGEKRIFPLRKHLALSSIALFLVILCPGDLLAGPVDHRDAFSRLLPAGELLYMPERYSSCLGCHTKALAEEEDFNVDTLFRDTKLGKNLHSLHIFRLPQGTNCSACHRIDTATGTLSFLSGIRLSISETGGQCTPSCHRPKEYRNAGRDR
jgi:mono/diheme cytochrome c family protein